MELKFNTLLTLSEILIMIGFSDRIRTHEELCDLFNNLHRVRHLIARSIIRLLRRFNFRLTENDNNLSKGGRPKVTTNEVIAQDIAIALEEFPQTSTISVTLKYKISCRPITRILTREKYHT